MKQKHKRKKKDKIDIVETIALTFIVFMFVIGALAIGTFFLFIILKETGVI